MPTLDIPTLLFLFVVVTLAMGGAAVFVSWGQHSHELWIVAAAACTLAFAFSLYSLRGQAPDLFTSALPNAFLSLSIALMLFALAQYRQVAIGTASLVAPVVAMALGSAILLTLPRMRVGFAMALGAAQLLLLARIALGSWPDRPGRGRYLVAASAGLGAVVMLQRGILIALGPAEGSNALARGPAQAAAFVVALIVIVLGVYGFLLMTKELADERNRLLASRDELTGTLSRRALMDQFERLLSHARRRGEPLAVLMIDLDHFKRVNDRHGHLAGDLVLRAVAEAIVARVRAEDVVGRFGGEEFLVLLPGVGRDGGLQLAEALREVTGTTQVTFGGKPVSVAASVGVYGDVPSAADTVDSLIEAADRALYRAKEGGRNRVEVA